MDLNRFFLDKKIFLINIKFFLLLILIQIKDSFTEYFETFQQGIISNNASLIDITDYHNIFPFITSEGHIYTGMEPNLKSETNSKLLNISAAATYDNNFILIACTENHLLSKININSGEETSLLSYNQFSLTIESLNYSCSICILNNIAYIGIPQIISNNLIKNVIKVELINENDNYGPVVSMQTLFTFDYLLSNLENITYTRQISCEIISPVNSLEETAVVCGYIKYNSTTQKYSYMASVLNSNFNAKDFDLQVTTSTSYLGIRLQKINSTYIRFLITKYSFEIYLKKENSKFKVFQTASNIRNANLYSFSSYNDLFYYHNQYIFSSGPTDSNNVVSFYLYLKSNISTNYIRSTYSKTYVHNVMGYYEENDDKFLFIYQMYKIIKYYTVQNVSFLYEFKCKAQTKEVISNTPTTFNVSELITYPLDHLLLTRAHVVIYNSTTYRLWSYNNHFDFNKTTQILNVSPSLNDWVTFYFYFYAGANTLSTYFVLPSCTISIRTCAYKCGSCSLDYNTCDDGCKLNFTKLRDSTDTECYPNDQNFPNYIYDFTTNYYEKCYLSCKFCSLKGSSSSNLNHNCLTCNEGYLKSYSFMGNCYKIDYPLNKSNIYKIVSNQEDENYTVINSCSEQVNKYIIASTGECISSCPTETVFHTYTYTYRNFSQQTTSALPKMYPLTIEKPPKFLFGNLCYQTCPSFTITDENNNLCKCKYGWEQNSNTKEITCYNLEEYCLNKDYYYHNDTKECVINGCRENYYQFNFECFIDNCPENTSLLSSDPNICETDLNYCYIDNNFKTHCSNGPFIEYNLQYKDTKYYFKFCNQSLFFYGIKTYLYKNRCYEECPDFTIKNDTNGKCSCKYYKIILNEETDYYDCLTETETCNDKNKIPNIDTKVCLDTLQDCIDKNYKIFNGECYTDCHDKIEQDDHYTCLCSNYYYNQSNYLTCFSSECDSEIYPIIKFDTKECFKNKEECIGRNYNMFNNLCYEICPNNSEVKNNDNICYCSYNYFNDSNFFTCFNLNENCEDNGYNYTNLDTKECFNLLNDCSNRGYKIFNNKCYNICPDNTNQNENNINYCKCSYYYYKDENNNLNCFDNGKTCEMEGYPYVNEETKECFESTEKCILKGYKVFNRRCYEECPINSQDVYNDNICLCQYYYFNNSNILECFEQGNNCSFQGYSYQNVETKECFNTKQECIQRGFKLFNEECYNQCPRNTELKDDENNCLCSNWYYNQNNFLICFDDEKNCDTENYPFKKFDTKECFLNKEECIEKNYNIFNNLCYDICPVNSEVKYGDNICYCSYNYFNDSNVFTCFNLNENCEDNGYNYTNLDTKECFNLLNDCINKGYKIFNNNCYNNCPDNTNQNENNINYCICSYYYYKDENNNLNCFDNGKTCEMEGYPYVNEETKECFESTEKCILKGYKVFNKRCYEECPINTQDVYNNNICLCSFYFYNNNGSLECFYSNETCESKGYEITGDSKECFISIEECLSKDYSYFYQDICYKNNCPSDKISLGSLQNNIKNELIKELNLINNRFSDNLCICDTKNTYIGWIINDSNPYIQICLDECPENYRLDEVTHKCYYCNPKKDYVFNDICYPDNCPDGTQLNSSNHNSRICICDEASIINETTGLIECIEKEYPVDYFHNRISCPFIYKGDCYQECPSNTCLTQNKEELTKCVDIKQKMKVFNGICFEGIEEIVNNIESLEPITTSQGITINAYSSEEDINELIKANPDLTFVDLGECNDLLIKTYNLPLDTKLYILGIDSPNLIGQSSINSFDFEIYLSNGTQLQDLSACENSKILVSSNIKVPESVNFDKASEFINLGYDIYNISNVFYRDTCAPSSDKGNDITLKDRVKYYYPWNVSICIEGCKYNHVDYETQRFICDCNVYNEEEEEIIEEEEEFEQSYLEYFLSLINYKIMTCYNLFFQFSSFYYNAGFYISFGTLIICIVLMFLFWIYGISKIKIIFYQNIPTKSKLAELFRKQEMKRQDNLNNKYKERNSNKKKSTKIMNENKDISFPPLKRNKQKDPEIENQEEKENNLSQQDIIVFNNNINRRESKKFSQNIENENVNLFENNNIKRKGNEKLSQIFLNKNENIFESMSKLNLNTNLQKIPRKSNKKRKTKKFSTIKNNIMVNKILNNDDNILQDKVRMIKRKNKTYRLHKEPKISYKNYKKDTFNSNHKMLPLEYNEKTKKEKELKIDFNFDRLIERNDDEIEKNEINNVPFRQALRIDKRTFFQIFLSVLTNQIGFLSMFFYKNPFSHFSLILSIYLFELLLDLTMNCFLYTDDIVSEKYHNDGQLTMFTSLSLSFISNIVSSIIVFIISKLTNYVEIIEAILKNVKDKRKYFDNIVRLFKYIKLRLGFYYLLQIIFIMVMTYYLFIFCTVYHQSQSSIMINYIIGACISLAISVGLTIIITIFRFLSFRYKSPQLFNVSKYLYEHF